MSDYLRYHDNLQQQQENEDAVIDTIVASMMRVNEKVFDKHRHAKRDAHAKSHGVLIGHVTVHDRLPAHLAQGVFATPATYPVVIRLSTAFGDIHSDKFPVARGMAIKMLGVSGHQFLPGREQANTQDLLLMNHPVIAFGHVAAYLKTQKLLEKHMDDPDTTKRIMAALARGGSKALHTVGIESPTIDTVGMPNNHILGETFFSMAAVRYGDYVAKLCAAPLSANVRALTGQIIDNDGGDSVLRDLVVDFFNNQGAEYELRAQLCTDVANMPIEDASVDWPQELSPTNRWRRSRSRRSRLTATRAGSLRTTCCPSIHGIASTSIVRSAPSCAGGLRPTRPRRRFGTSATASRVSKSTASARSPTSDPA